ncbi:MAG TPA: methylenetetrahydrofolate--tRNA-(uracil(54)-C(5))-methyltransferase (FADH(2)-oxidizing) TrmFO [Kofleriaceae bacterium]|nr:methylenetetrahydrofolate--tRNA-(uracil(54)-C(5))-methyltransferase (FADH(2)-oxidizing) TrmFO [Kofleriaceae bacterium]
MTTWRDPDVTVVGGGMAGCEAAWQLAERGLRVALVEQKPAAMSPAHQTPLLGELVCSNSLRSNDVDTPAGLLKHELRQAGSMVIGCADQHRVPAGQALAVERFGFGRAITVRLAVHPNVRLERRPLDELPAGPVIVATGPLTGGPLGAVIRKQLGGDRMYFYDAIAPIVAAESIDMDHAFKASRWGKDQAGRRPKPAAPGTPPPDDAADGAAEDVGDYINCPIDKDTYVAFVEAVRSGRKVTPHEFEEPRYFESCLPIEVMADRGLDVLRFGPMRPVGLTDPRTGRWPYAVVQLRPENRYLTAYNLVGFQTRLAYPEQQRIFAMVPALARAEWLRFGSIHRNTYVDAPRLLGPRLELRSAPALRFAGLLTGVEGYIESCAMGLVCAWLLADELAGRPLAPPPPTTMLGALYQHVTGPRPDGAAYAPTNVNFGLLPPADIVAHRKDKQARRKAQIARALADVDAWIAGARRAA